MIDYGLGKDWTTYHVIKVGDNLGLYVDTLNVNGTPWKYTSIWYLVSLIIQSYTIYNSLFFAKNMIFTKQSHVCYILCIKPS